MTEFLLELLSEEIPSRMQAPAAEDLRRLLTSALGHVSFGASFSFSTPRRIGCVIEDLPEHTPDKSIETRGPRVGAPDAAIAGFLRATGLGSIDQCTVRETEKGSFYIAVRNEPGRAIDAELAALVPDCLDRLSWPKSMRWADHDVRWVRPLQGILALLSTAEDARLVPVVWRLDRGREGGAMLESGDQTVGHRFLAPAPISVSNFAGYRQKLAAAFVLLECSGDAAQSRRARIADQIAACAAEEGLSVQPDAALLDEVTGLVEWPVARLGRIDPRFMALPRELLTTSMRSHQKYFACELADGSLAPNFVVVGNNETRDGGRQMVAGNERVLRARLSDAEFFWQQDRATRLEARLPRLAERVFHARLGSVRDKVDRMVALAELIVPAVTGADLAAARRAIELAKADLSSQSVGEFPELQGVMGRYLALNDGETPEIAEAIEQHYAPTGLGGAVPSAPLAIVAALADKIDTLAGFFAIDEPPTGSKDPYALRRAALGIIRIVLDNALRLPLRRVFDGALQLLPVSAADACSGQILAFIADRLKIVLREAGIGHDIVTAVFSLDAEDDLFRLRARARALVDFLATEDGGNLLAAYRRAGRIVQIEEKKDRVRYDQVPDATLFRETEERQLAERLREIDQLVEQAIQSDQFDHAGEALRALRQRVDAFFDKVTVNVEDTTLRANRLRLLAGIRAALDRVADFSKIEG